MNGVMIPSVSAGSSQRVASVMWTPHVIVPSGADEAGPAPPRMPRHARNTLALRPPRRTGTRRPGGEGRGAGGVNRGVEEEGATGRENRRERATRRHGPPPPPPAPHPPQRPPHPRPRRTRKERTTNDRIMNKK